MIGAPEAVRVEKQLIFNNMCPFDFGPRQSEGAKRQHVNRSAGQSDAKAFCRKRIQKIDLFLVR